jgi:hypothetical protein
MTTPARQNSALDRECSAFCRYLIGQEPSEYVKQKYRAAHQIGSLRRDFEDAAEAFLVRIAGIGSWSTKIIDAYTRVFRPFSTVRRKLILLLAILESCAPTHVYLDSVDSDSSVWLLVQVIQRCITFALILSVGMLIILPAEIMLRTSVRRIVLWPPRNG